MVSVSDLSGLSFLVVDLLAAEDSFPFFAFFSGEWLLAETVFMIVFAGWLLTMWWRMRSSTRVLVLLQYGHCTLCPLPWAFCMCLFRFGLAEKILSQMLQMCEPGIYKNKKIRKKHKSWAA